MDLIIRHHKTSELPQIFALITELSFFEKVPDHLTNTLELMESEKDHFYAFVAVTPDEEVVGYATYNTVYYTWSGKSIYMDDLYVKSSHRSQGIGSQLIQAVINHAKGSGCHKVRWQVSEWNAPAIAFYKKLGAEINAVEKNCDLMLM
ncbi:MAG: GNAT family N-acetyltransferase [Saprospiraceae bacterium]|jgi:ribosomal protein S18 acetylase RimI-like enzyme|nr:GNAT family N-acetyltransferase [Saprospiraceae bacterium]